MSDDEKRDHDICWREIVRLKEEVERLKALLPAAASSPDPFPTWRRIDGTCRACGKWVAINEYHICVTCAAQK